MKPMNTDRILYEDNDIIVCHKPAGIATQTARVGQADMVSEITNYLAMTTKGSSPYVGVVHRLDQPVEGVLVFAKNRQAAADLGRQIQESRMEKYYYAVVCGRDFKPCGELTDYLLKDGKANTSCVVPSETKDAKKAVLDYRVLAEQTCEEAADMALRIALVEIHLHTGRHHQIRVQMSHAGMSLLGDYKYAEPEVVKVSEQMNIKEIALCAYKLSFLHPGTGKLLQFQIEPEGRSFQIHDWKNYADGGSHNGV